MDCSRIVFSGHALRRMFERVINDDEVRTVVANGEVIAEYPDDTPDPNALLLGWVRGRPLHVVVGRDPATARCVIITAYEPEPHLWERDFKRRRRR